MTINYSKGLVFSIFEIKLVDGNCETRITNIHNIFEIHDIPYVGFCKLVYDEKLLRSELKETNRRLSGMLTTLDRVLLITLDRVLTPGRAPCLELAC